MTTIAVTGAAGSVGRRVVALLSAEPDVESVKALDRLAMAGGPSVETHRIDVAEADVADVLEGCRTVVHLAEDPGRRSDELVATTTLQRVLDATERAGCRHVVLLSSALVYGAYADNPVPLTERHQRRPVPELAYAVTKTRLEELAERWADQTSSDLAILRPTTTLSERGVSYIAGALRSATSLRPEQVDPPVQFLHHDDLASAVSLVATRAMASIYNVAPDGWIGPEVFRDLLTEAELHWPEPLDPVMGRMRAALGRRRAEVGLDAHVSHPWVVANDRLRAAGWCPAFTNEEAFVAGNPAPVWRTFALRRRQELALGAVGAATVGVMGAAGLVARRLFRAR
ncbi:MAG: NAD-dependent epimerase/dehydratase family protein [Acidimicrobiia bacterium]|nr:NAD-dependent epimerase/dehydratase family protein [Acidimicrobiia bacterium]